MKEKEQEKLSPDFDRSAQESDPALAAQIHDAFAAIKPDDAAKARMYQNILKKTAPSLVPIQRRSHRSLRRYLSLAACLLLVITAGFSLPKWLASGDGNLPGSNPGRDSELQDPPTLTASPYVDVDSPEDFAQLGFVIDAPADASNVTYCIAYGTTAQVDFTIAEHRYTYLAQKATEDSSDISGLYGTVQEQLTLTLVNRAGEETAIKLEKASTTDPEASAGTAGEGSDTFADIWRATWQTEDITYCLLNEDGTSEETFTAILQELVAKV